MVIMHLATMNHCEQEELVDPHDLIHQASGDSVSSAAAGDQQPFQQLTGAVTTSRGSGGCMRAAERPVMKPIPCPRCQSMNTKFCYYNNYSVNQPRHFCRNCQRYWTVGGTLRNVPVGGGTRKKVHRTRQRMSSSDELQPRDSRGDFSPAAGAGLNALNMTQVVQSNVLLPSTLQNLVSTQQQLSLLSSQMTGAGGKVGSMSSYGNYQQPVLQQQSGSVTELPPNTTTTTSPHFPTFLRYLSNLDHERERQNIHGSFNAGSSLSKNLLAASTTPATSTAGLMMNLQQDHVMVSTSLHSSTTSSMYEHQSSTSSVPMNSRGLQLAGGGSNIVQAAPGSLFSNVIGGYYTVSSPQKLDGNQIEFLNSVLQKPGYWGA
jgi:hypothetical protein